MPDLSDSTQLLPRPAWEQPRVHLLDDAWLLTLLAVLGAALLSWVTRAFEMELGNAGWGLLGLAALYVVLTLLGAPARPGRGGRAWLLVLLDAVGVGLIGFIWLNLGALQNPLFLLVFTLPVIGAVFLSRWHPFLVALLSCLVVGAIALLQAPELRWYLTSLVGAEGLLGWLRDVRLAGAAPPLSGGTVPLAYELLMLEVFALMMLACAIAAEYLGGLFERLSTQAIVARAEAERGQELWVDLIHRLPLPALLVDPDTGVVVAASDSAVTLLHVSPPELIGHRLFEALRVSYPDMLQELLTGSDGEVSQTVVHIGQQLRITRAHILHVTHKTRRLALLTLQDNTERFCLKAALDTAEYAAVVIDARGCLLALNKPAGGLFPNAEIGAPVTRLLPRGEGPPWWEPGLSGRRKLHLEIGARLYQVTSSAVPLTGEEQRIVTVSFLPLAREAAADTAGSTRLTQISG
ncbi:MAG: hypothetical protein JO341_14125 [Gammaproteobacteria bacterium]|nr:hypothetical protein [Gammaproteobacteria bacterium]MBV9622142.1 hypothetical protein [Gammaproteobacteria bacterium]